MPPLLVLHLGDALALEGPGQHDGRPVTVAPGLGERPVDGARVVAVDHDRAAAERLDPGRVAVHVPLELGRASLAEAVHVHDGGQVPEPVVAALVERLPHGPLRHLAVAAQDPDVERELVEVLAGNGDADRVGQALAEGSGRHVDPREHRGRVTLQAGAELPVRLQQLLLGDDPDRPEHGVEQRRGVALGEHDVVVGGQVGPVPVVAQVAEEQHRHEVGRRHRRRGVPGLRLGAAPDRVDPQLASQLAGGVELVLGHRATSSGGFWEACAAWRNRPNCTVTAAGRDPNRAPGKRGQVGTRGVAGPSG